MTTPGPTKTRTDTTPALVPADPTVAETRALSGRTHLKTAEARRRYALILRLVAGLDGRPQVVLARLLGCSDSNVSRLIREAKRAIPHPDET